MVARLSALALLLALALTASGCAEWNSIFRKTTIESDGNVNDAKIIAIDAKQRVILTSRRKTGNKLVDSYRAFCTEPSPDVFSVLSQAASLSGSFGESPEAINAALQAAMSSAETGAAIPRTQTINMLREMMYRTCERYISGALDDTQFAVQAIRDQRTMVSILAIEQLTGAVTPPRVLVASGGTAGAAGESSDALVRLDDAWKAKTSAAQSLEKANAGLTALDATDSGLKSAKKCDDLLKAKPEDVSDTDDKTKLTKCQSAQKAIEDATTAKKAADEHYAELKALAGGGAASTSTAPVVLTLPGDAIQHTAQTDKVAEVVQSIVKLNFDQDEVVLFCLRGVDDPRQKISDACIDYMTSKVDKETAAANSEVERLKADAARQKLLTAEMLAETDSLHEKLAAAFVPFWNKVASQANADLVDTQRLTDVVDTVAKTVMAQGAKTRLDRLKKASTKIETYRVFRSLSPAIQKKLSS